MTTLTLSPNQWISLEGARQATVGNTTLNTTLGNTDGRARRVLVLLAGVALLSAGDLVVTLAHMQSIGMFEHNPIVRHLVHATGSGWSLVVYKSLTVVCAVALLYPLRRRVQGEVGAWLGMLMLAGVCVMWWRYADLLADLSGSELQQFARLHTNWVELPK